MAGAAGEEIELLIKLLAKLPGLGPRSARRAALNLVKQNDQLLKPLADAMASVGQKVKTCATCQNIDVIDPCNICIANNRDKSIICVVEEVGDLWALERTCAFKGTYHVLGGHLSALDGILPKDLHIETLIERAKHEDVKEIILAMNATIDGQTTAHYITDRLAEIDVVVSRLAHGVPVGGELDYLDDGTISAALSSRRPF